MTEDSPVARVRYMDFRPAKPKQRYPWQSPPNRRKSVQAPSGHVYTFRGSGHSKSCTSQSLPIHEHREVDVEFFRGMDGYQVKRDGEILDDLDQPATVGDEQEVTEEDSPAGRARWTGAVGEARPRTAKRSSRKAGVQFTARGSKPSPWQDVYDRQTLEELEQDADVEVEWYS